ncbi:MAG TPA: cell cycle transcriptional regulator TrcR [Geminicoccaceae bacterium]|nr:cell cycle transcriptional regulator TrcR [Geminicoccaceae bacterium]
MDRPLMPKATAVWLVENTSLTFEQIADFCGLHPLEVKGIADGEVAAGIRGLDPVAAGQLERGEVERCQKDPKARLRLARPAAAEVKPPKRREPRYTPLSKRQDRPDAIAWLLRHHPEMTDVQICKLLGTTKATVTAVRERTHWKSQEIRPRDPVLLGLTSQVELDDAVAAARNAQSAQAGAASPVHHHHPHEGESRAE